MKEVANPPSADALMFALLEAAHALQGRMEEACTGVGLSSARYGVLDQLVGAGEPLLLSELADRLRCVRSNMTQLVDRLEADGLVRRLADPNDRRCVRAELTSRGRERYADGAEQLRRVQDDFTARLSEAERAALLRTLSSLV